VCVPCLLIERPLGQEVVDDHQDFVSDCSCRFLPAQAPFQAPERPLKGPSLFWCRASAEAILLLRSYYKAGRWNMLKRMATSHLASLAA
jgi:hypothetical protein